MTLVLLPGLDGTEILFRPFTAALPRHIRSRILTLPAAGPYDYARLVPLLESAVSDLDEFFLLGWSFSGALALRLAERCAPRVRGVVLVATFVRQPLPWVAPWRFAVNPFTVAIVRAVRRAPLFLGSGTREFRRAKRETWKRVNARALAHRSLAVFDLDAREDLKRCPAPLLYLGSSRDAVVPRHNVDEVAALRPDIERVTIDGPHLALFTNAAAAAATVTTFIGRHQPAS